MRVALSLLAVLASVSVAVADSSSPADTAAAPTDTAAAPADNAAAPSDKVAADTGTTNDADADKTVAVGLAANVPFRWPDGGAVGVSGYIAFGQHHAIRINYARYKYGAFDIGEASHRGHTTDVGIGYQYFTRALFDGWMLEGGVFRRDVDHGTTDEFATPAIEETKGKGYAGRALVGYSLLWEKRLFLSAAVGMSVGRYTGTDRTAETTDMPVYKTDPFVRWEPAAEGYVRLGLVFGL